MYRSTKFKNYFLGTTYKTYKNVKSLASVAFELGGNMPKRDNHGRKQIIREKMKNKNNENKKNNTLSEH